jgi:hypothetical protein
VALGTLVVPATTYAQGGSSVLDQVSSGPIPAPEERILATGDPPLTEAMAMRFTDFVGWIFEIPFTGAQRDRVRAILVADWQRDDRNAISQDLATLQTAAEVAKHSDAEREFLRQKVQPGALTEARAKSDPDMKWLMGLYDAAHKQLAPGAPPLTRQISDDYLDVLCFMHNQVAPGPPLSYQSEEAKQFFARELTKAWGKADAARRQHWASMRLARAALLVAWPQLPEDQRAGFRKQFRGYLQAIAPDFLKTVPQQASAPTQAAARQGGNPAAYAQAMARLQRQHDSYVFMSNMMLMNHVANMNMLSNIGGGGYHYEIVNH